MADEIPATTPSLSSAEQTETSNEGAAELRAPLQRALSGSADDVALRDDLTSVQTSGPRAAQLSGEHFSRLLYGPDADMHISPYGVPPVPNSLDSREK